MEKEKYKVVATKVKPQVERMLKSICAKKGTTLYDMLQMMCDCMVRYMSDEQNLTPEMEQAMSIFEHMEGWAGAFNLADYTTEAEVREATYFIGDKTKTGVRALHVVKPWMGQWGQTLNIQEILERTMMLILPERYMRIRRLGADMGCRSFLEVIDKLIDEHADDEYLKAIREEFEDANRSDFGVKPTEHRYKQTKHRNVDSVARQLDIRFKSDDESETPAP